MMGGGGGGGGFEKYIIYLLEIVVAAGKQESLGCVAAPAQEGRHTGSNRVGPQTHQDNECLHKCI